MKNAPNSLICRERKSAFPDNEFLLSSRKWQINNIKKCIEATEKQQSFVRIYSNSSVVVVENVNFI